MKMHSSIRIATVAALLAAACLPRTAAAQGKVAIDRRLPKDVFAYVTVPSVPELKKRFQATNYGALLRDKAFEPFLKDVEVAIKKHSAEIERKLGLKLDDLLEIPGGEIAIAVAKSDRAVPTMAAFIDFGKKEGTVDKLLEFGSKEAEKAGLKRSEVSFKDTKIVVYAKPGEDGDAKKKLDVAYFIKDSYFVFATNIEFLKSVITRWDGRHESTFAHNETYKYIKERTRTGRDGVFTWYIDPLGLVKAALLSNPDVPGLIKMGFGFLKPLGIDKFRAAGGTVDMALGEYESINKTVLYVDLPAAGTLKLFNFPAAELSPPKWVPATAASYTAINWDLSKAYEGAANLVDTIFGLGQAGVLDKKIADWAKEGPKIHLKKDVLDNLTGRIHVATDFIDPEDAATMQLLFAAGVKDEKKMNAVLEKVAKIEKFPGKAKKIGDVTVYEFELDFLPIGGGGKLMVGIVRNQLMVCSDAKLFEAIVKAKDPAKSLADSAEYRRIAARFPKKASMTSFERDSTQLKTIYDQVRSGTLGEIGGIDFTKLPPFAALAKHLRSSGSYAVPDKHGVYMEGFSLKKKP